MAKVIICGQPWEVYMASSHDAVLIVDGKDCMGTTWVVDHRIYINTSVNAMMAEHVVRHEVTHAVLYSSQITTPEQFSEENVCDFIGDWGPEIERVSKIILKEFWHR